MSHQGWQNVKSVLPIYIINLVKPTKATAIALKELIETSDIYRTNYELVEIVVESVIQKETITKNHRLSID